jgi:O-antigen/teichoic acid export membrane protein
MRLLSNHISNLLISGLKADFLIRLFNMLLGLFFGVLITNFLSPTNRGAYALIVNYSMINSIILAFGFPDYLLKYRNVKSIKHEIQYFLVLISILLPTIFIINKLFLSKYFIEVFFFSVIQLSSLIFRYILYIKKSVFYGELYQLIISLTNFIVVIIIYTFNIQILYNVSTWIWISLVVNMFTLVSFFLINDFNKIKLTFSKIELIDLKSFFTVIFGFGLISIGGIMISKFIYYFIGSYNDFKLLAQFSVSEIISSMLTTFYSVIIIRSSISIYEQSNNKNKVMINTISLIIITSLISFLFLFLFGPILFTTIYGEAYSNVGKYACLQVPIAALSSISSLIVVFNISRGILYHNVIPGFVIVLSLYFLKNLIPVLNLPSLFLIIIIVNIMSLIILLLIGKLNSEPNNAI